MDAAGFSRFTKIVATLGGVSSSPEMLEQLTSAGVNVFRLNFSHGTQEEQGARIRAIRDLEARTGKPTCILADLQGPKHRVGVVAEGTILEVGQTLRFDQSPDEGMQTVSACRTPKSSLLSNQVRGFLSMMAGWSCGSRELPVTASTP